MRYEKLFVVNTRSISLEENYLSNFAKELGKIINLDSYKYIDVPFKKTDNTDIDEYVEMITGTLYYRKGDKFVSNDSLMSFTVRAMEYYYDEKFGKFCSNHSLLLVKWAMQLVYQKERIKAGKDRMLFITNEEYVANAGEKGAKILSKLERKHRNKLEGRK